MMPSPSIPFRGANYKNMFEFPKLFSDTKIIRLEQNYRSTQPILNLTNALMEQAEEKYTKCLFTERQEERGRRSWMRERNRSRRCSFAGRSRNSFIRGAP